MRRLQRICGGYNPIHTPACRPLNFPRHRDLLPKPGGLALQATIDYYLPHVTFKTLIGVTSAPVVTQSVTTGWNDLTFGGQVRYDSAKNDGLIDWSAAVGEPPLPPLFLPTPSTHTHLCWLGPGSIFLHQAYISIG
jgi:hypothetical protein